MEIKLMIDASPELLNALNSLANALDARTRGIAEAVTVLDRLKYMPEPEPEKESPKKEEKHVKQAAPEPTNDTPEPEEQAESNNSDEPIPTVIELRAKAQEIGKTPEAKKAIKALLNEFGSKSISDIPEEKRAAFMARLEAL